LNAVGFNPVGITEGYLAKILAGVCINPAGAAIWVKSDHHLVRVDVLIVVIDSITT
jgi:hypothetical protein